MSGKLTNIPLKKYRKFLKKIGCQCNRKSGGHEHWSSSDIDRPLTLQSHISPVPAFIILQHLRHLKMTREEFFEVYKNI